MNSMAIKQADLKGNLKKIKFIMSEYGIYKKQQYIQFFGFLHEPFPVAPDNSNFFISTCTNKILTNILQGIFYRKGFMLLIGEVGLGKTTLSRRIIEILETNDVEVSLILQSFYQGTDLLKEINKDFGITGHCPDNLSALMGLLTDFLLEKNSEDINCAIVIDDAQNLSYKSLELIRMISNLEADRKKLVQILLVGQPELMEKLNSHTLRQLKSRVTVLQESRPLEKSELDRYLKFKLKTAGDKGKIILEKGIVNTLYKITSGNLRMVNILMDRALVMASYQKTFIIKTEFVELAGNELEFKTQLKVKSEKSVKFYLSLILVVTALFIIGFAADRFYYFHKEKKSLFNNAAQENSKNFIITKKIPAKKIIHSK